MQNFIKNVVLGCLFIIPFIVLHIADGGIFDVLSYGGGSGLFFPFISGKNLIFRILVEIAFAGWAVLALMDSKYRINLKKSPLTIAYAIFVTVLLIADMTGVDPVRSMWSNFERMEGFVGHIHLFAYFFVLSTMLPTLKDWQKMWNYFIVSNILILIYAFGQLMGAPYTFFAVRFPEMAAWFAPRFPIHMSGNRLDATIGNSAYFAIFCLMFIFITALVWSQRIGTKRAWFYPTLIALNLVGLFYSGTRGTMIGAVVGGLITLGIVAQSEKGRARKMFAGVFIVVAILVSSIFVFKNTTFIKSSSTLSRLSSISPSDLTGSSRLAMWTISYHAWLEKPLLGYGQDNFSYIFARKFLPEKMCNLEPWYDRSHDVFFDWLVAGGALGLLSYLSLYGVALSLVWRKINTVPLREKAIITGAIIGYFIHNIFVFDNLTSYILFAALLGYIVVRTQGDNFHTHGKAYFDNEQMTLLWAPIIGIVLVVTQYYINYRPLIVNRLVIDGMSISQYSQAMPLADAIKRQQDAFTRAIDMDTLGSEEAREQFLQNGVRLAQYKIPEGTPEASKLAIQQAINAEIQAIRDDVTKSLPSHLEDVRMLTIYGMFFVGIGDAKKGEEIISSARNLAPKKQLIGFDLTRAYLMQGKHKEAYELSKEVYDLSTNCNNADKWYLISAAYAGKYKDAKEDILKKGGTVGFEQEVLTGFATTGQIGLAIEYLQELKKTRPDLASQIDAYIGQLLTTQIKVAPPVKK